mgnify:CR=1 FL=1
MSASKTPPHTVPNEESLIEYPCIFPIKVMGRHVQGFSEAIVAVAQQFDPGFDADSVEHRPSSSGNSLGLTITVTASTLSDLEKSKRGGTPESPGVRQ